MRILVVHPGPNFSVADVYAGWVEALKEAGHTVATYDLSTRITFYENALVEMAPAEGQLVKQFRKAVSHEQALEMAANGLLSTCFQWWPDVVLCISAFFIPPQCLEIIRARRMKVVLMFTESPYQDEEQLRLVPQADMILLNDPTNLSKFKDQLPSSYFLPHAYRPGLHHPGPASEDMVCDFAFVGTAFLSRIEFFEAMGLDGLDVLLAGNWRLLDEKSPLQKHLALKPEECLDNSQTVELYRSMRVGMNLYRREVHFHGAVGSNFDALPNAAQFSGDPGNEYTGPVYAMGPREVEMAACEAFFLRDPRAESDEILHMLPSFESPGEATDLLHFYLERPDAREQLAKEARQAIWDRTFLNNARQFSKWLEML